MSKNFTFNTAPTVQMRRQRITGLSYGCTSSYSMGTLYPFYCEEILPGDTFKVDSDLVIRLTSSFIKPVYGSMFADVFYFFVPWRLVYDDWACVFGENKDGYWANQHVYEVPHLFAQNVTSKSLADYLEFPVGNINAPVNVLYHRAVALIWNEFFRDENYQQPVYIHKGAAQGDEAMNSNIWSVNNYTGMCPPINKYRDYFTSVLPSPQKGEALEIALGGNDPLLVYAGKNPHPSQTEFFNGNNPIQWSKANGSPFDATKSGYYGIQPRATTASTVYQADGVYDEQGTGSFAGSIGLSPQNLYADPTSLRIGNVNDLRMAFQAQKILERDALGTRYCEHILNTFGVTNPDSRLQRPEILNSAKIPINIQQVASTQANTASSSILRSLRLIL